jgi:hypothetical protein
MISKIELFQTITIDTYYLNTVVTNY